MTKLDKKLNLVIPVDGAWVHAMPVSYAIFDKYFLNISKTFGVLYSEVGSLAAPRVAYMLLKKIALADGSWEGPEGVENGLVNEIIRLANVVLPSQDKKGWQTLPLYAVQQQKLFDEEQMGEVLGQLVFFTLASSMHKRDALPGVLDQLTKWWGGLTTSLDVLAFSESLKQSTTAETSVKKETASPTTS